jgi:hypothetical protein
MWQAADFPLAEGPTRMMPWFKVQGSKCVKMSMDGAGMLQQHTGIQHMECCFMVCPFGVVRVA